MFIPISLALLALTAGMFLLAKTTIEELGSFFKVVSFFIIISSCCIIVLSILTGFTRIILHKMHTQNHLTCVEEHRCKKHHESFNEYQGRNERRHKGHNRWGYESGYEHRGAREYTLDERVEHATGRLSEKLNLTTEQIAKTQDILRTFFKKENELKTQATLNWEEFKKLQEENRKNKTDAIKKILTPEELKLLTEEEYKESNSHHYQ